MFLENRIHAIHGKREQVEVLICVCFLYQSSDFITYTLLCAKYVLKIF